MLSFGDSSSMVGAWQCRAMAPRALVGVPAAGGSAVGSVSGGRWVQLGGGRLVGRVGEWVLGRPVGLRGSLGRGLGCLFFGRCLGGLWVGWSASAVILGRSQAQCWYLGLGPPANARLLDQLLDAKSI